MSPINIVARKDISLFAGPLPAAPSINRPLVDRSVQQAIKPLEISVGQNLMNKDFPSL